MIDLRAADPAADLTPDPSGTQAQALLREVLAQPRGRAPHVRLRRYVAAGGLTAAAAVAAALVLPSHGGSDLGPAGYRVAADHGTVRVVVRWGELRDPAALRRALDRAHARTTVYVEPDGARLCAPGATTGYRAGAVDWHVPHSASEDDGIVLRPHLFPPGATFVLVVSIARPGSGASTFAPGEPAITATLSYMATGSDTDPAC